MEVVVCSNPRDCINYAYDTCKSLEATGFTVRCDKRHMPIDILYWKEGFDIAKSILVVDKITYKTWCMGRTYYMNGKLYHSGQVINFERW